MVRAKASRLWLTTPLNSGAIPNLVPNSIFLNFFSMTRAYGTTTPSAQEMGDQGYDAYTLDEALSKIGFGKFQVGVLAYAGLGWIAEAMEMMLLSFVGPAIQPQWGLSSSQESLISTVAFGGMLVGAYSWGVVSDSYGRKKGFLGSTIITSVAGLVSAFAPNYISLLILRCIVGVGLGCGHVFTSWLEFVPTPNRGAWMIVFATFWTVGTIMEASLAWWIMPTYGWRLLLGLSAVPSFVALLFYGLVPVSPRYLCTQGRLTDAHYILANGATFNSKDLSKGLLVSDHINESTNEGFVLLLPLVVHQNAKMTTGFLFGARMFISASFIVACIYAPEVYPTNLRATGVGIATAISRIVGGMVTILLSDVTVMLLPFETNGKELADT
ncbi:organic cation/carnitine transporter 7-like protein [Tanacetum coccineum]